MKNNQLFPFERNRYYQGKMLTSADFRAEQNYMNNKRRFINNMLFGSGILCGCNVFSLDDLSVMIESGAALDDFGREVVLEAAVVKKLSAIEGFDRLETQEALLCLKYEEEPVHAVYTAAKQEEDGYEYNRVREGCSLFLMDAAKDVQNDWIENEFFIQECVEECSDYQIELQMPQEVVRGNWVKAVFTLRKLSDAESAITWNGALKSPGFVSKTGGQEWTVAFEQVRLSKGEQLQRELWLKAESREEETSLVLESSKGSSLFSVQMKQESLEGLLLRAVGKGNLEITGAKRQRDYVPLARLLLMKTDGAYLIEQIIEEGVKKYVSVPGFDLQRREYRSYFAGETVLQSSETVQQDNTKQQETPAFGKPVSATGLLEIPVGADVKRGEVCYSGEITHGLGPGQVYVVLGREYTEENPQKSSRRSTVFGSPRLFDEEEKSAGEIITAVKVFNDRGSFIAAAKIPKPLDTLYLSYRWAAFVLPEEEALQEEPGQREILAGTPTVVLEPGESHYFSVVTRNIGNSSLTYEIQEEEGGTITPEGIYTAPEREGVYEICIYCSDMPAVCTYVYVIVRRKTEEK